MGVVRWNFPDGSNAETLTAPLAGCNAVMLNGGLAEISTLESLSEAETGKSARFVKSAAGHHWVAQEFSAVTRYAYDIYVKFKSFGNNAYLIWAGATSSLRSTGVFISSERFRLAVDGNTNLWTSSVNIPANTWVRLSVWADCATGEVRCAWYLGSETTPQDDSGILTGAALQSNINRIRYGAAAASVGTTGFELYIGSWAYDVEAPLGLIPPIGITPEPETSPIVFGNLPVSAMTFGGTPIKRVFYGDTLIWGEAEEPPPPDPPPSLLTLTEYNDVRSKRIVFAHQSVGLQVIQGTQMWADQLSASDPNVVDVVNDSIPSSGGFFGHFYAGTNGDPQSKLDHLDSLMRGGLASEVDFCILKFCYADLRNSNPDPLVWQAYAQNIFNSYKTYMDALVSSFPAVKFIFATSAIVMGENSDGAHNKVRNYYNDLVRAEYASTGRLWDVAGIESTDPDDNKILYNGYESLYSGYASPDQRHIYGLGRTTVSSYLLRMIASL